MNSKLTKNGYTIRKSEHSTSLIKEVKDELTVKPFSYNKFWRGYQKAQISLRKSQQWN